MSGKWARECSSEGRDTKEKDMGKGRREWEPPGGHGTVTMESDCRDPEKECLALAGRGALACSLLTDSVGHAKGSL